MKSEFRQCADELVGLLDLKNRPVAVTFSNDPQKPTPGKASLCQALKGAGRGKTFVIDKKSSACPGGSWHCGLTEMPSGPALRGLQEFLTRGEKLYSSITSTWRMLEQSSSLPTGLSDLIVIGPLEDMGLRPDIVVFICNPEQVCRLLHLDQYWDGIPPEVQLSGSLCHSVITYPVVTGRTNVSFGDWTARRMVKFKKDDVFMSVPYERMANLIKAIPECSAGTAELEGFAPRGD